MSKRTYDPEDDEQAQALLRALGDAFNQRALRVLMAEELTQAQLAKRLDVGQSTLSRRLAPLRMMGLLSGGRTRNESHHVAVRDEALSVLLSAHALAEAI